MPYPRVSNRIMNYPAAELRGIKMMNLIDLSTSRGRTYRDNPLSPPLVRGITYLSPFGKGDYLIFPWGRLPGNKASRNSFRLKNCLCPINVELFPLARGGVITDLKVIRFVQCPVAFYRPGIALNHIFFFFQPLT